jgi:hypothetical protein
VHVDAAARAAAFAAFFIVLYVGTAGGALGVGLLTGPMRFYPAVVTVAVAVIAVAAATLVVSARSSLLVAATPAGGGRGFDPAPARRPACPSSPMRPETRPPAR